MVEGGAARVAWGGVRCCAVEVRRRRKRRGEGGPKENPIRRWGEREASLLLSGLSRSRSGDSGGRA